ncbi:MAG: YaaC family protein, partial [bacterium]
LTTRKEGISVTVKTYGTFPTLHSIVAKERIKPGTRFGIEDLLSMIPWISKIETQNIPPLSASYLLGFLLSMISRYDPILWNTV